LRAIIDTEASRSDPDEWEDKNVLNPFTALTEPDLISQSRQAWNTGNMFRDMFPGAGKQRMRESMTGTTWLSSQPASYPARTRRNIEESDGTVIFSLERFLSEGTKLTQDFANKLGKPVLHIYDTRKERIIQPGFASPRDSRSGSNISPDSEIQPDFCSVLLFFAKQNTDVCSFVNLFNRRH
jgi:Circularly permutated YpsA SLOG family